MNLKLRLSLGKIITCGIFKGCGAFWREAGLPVQTLAWGGGNMGGFARNLRQNLAVSQISKTCV